MYITTSIFICAPNGQTLLDYQADDFLTQLDFSYAEYEILKMLGDFYPQDYKTFAQMVPEIDPKLITTAMVTEYNSIIFDEFDDSAYMDRDGQMVTHYAFIGIARNVVYEHLSALPNVVSLVSHLSMVASGKVNLSAQVIPGFNLVVYPTPITTKETPEATSTVVESQEYMNKDQLAAIIGIPYATVFRNLGCNPKQQSKNLARLTALESAFGSVAVRRAVWMSGKIPASWVSKYNTIFAK